MKVLTVFAQPASHSFCHAVLDRFDAGLRDAGHTNEIVDIYAIGFDPVIRPRDNPSWLAMASSSVMLSEGSAAASAAGPPPMPPSGAGAGAAGAPPSAASWAAKAAGNCGVQFSVKSHIPSSFVASTTGMRMAPTLIP